MQPYLLSARLKPCPDAAKSATCMVGLLVLTVYTIYDLQRPFRGSWPVKRRPYILIQERMQQVLHEQRAPISPVGTTR